MKKKDFISISLLLIFLSAVVIYEYGESIRQVSKEGVDKEGKPYIRTVSSKELQQMISSDLDFALIDLRSKEQYDEGHIPSALAIPFPELPSRLNSFEKTSNIVLYCKSGPWSRVSYKDMQKKGFSNVKILQNGIVGWKWEINGELVVQN
ncbi:MAG: rhodanese-like domain-containing protein [Proteobacteria bacterium]|nr:rhodanese-like domain-containing protein [Pseudomonadota bacterium]